MPGPRARLGVVFQEPSLDLKLSLDGFDATFDRYPRVKLALARHWMADQDNEPATWLAEQAEVDARFAEAKAQMLDAQLRLANASGTGAVVLASRRR